MDGYGLEKRLTKAFKTAVVGVALFGALVGGAVVYIAGHAGSGHTSPQNHTQQVHAPDPK